MAPPLYVPLNVDIAETSGRLNIQWRQFFQSLNQNIGPMTGAITSLTGDVTATGPGAAAATLSTTGVSAGSYGSGTQVGSFTVDAKGRLTAAANVTITNQGTVTHTGSLTANQLVLGNGTADIKPLGSLGTTTTVYHGNAGGAGSFAAVSLTADVSGILPVLNGGTGSATGASLRRDSVTLTNAQIKALPTTPIDAVLTPGAGFSLLLHLVLFIGKFQGGAYTGVDTTLSWMSLRKGAFDFSGFIANDSTATPALTHLTDFFTTTGYTLGNYLLPQQLTADPTLNWGLLAIGITPIADNLPLKIFVENGGVDFGGGHADNTLTVVTYYTVEPLP